MEVFTCILKERSKKGHKEYLPDWLDGDRKSWLPEKELKKYPHVIEEWQRWRAGSSSETRKADAKWHEIVRRAETREGKDCATVATLAPSTTYLWCSRCDAFFSETIFPPDVRRSYLERTKSYLPSGHACWNTRHQAVDARRLLKGIEYIDGPALLYEVEGLNRHIYLFGEHHDWTGGCPGDRESMVIDAFVEKLLVAYPDRIIDIFLETPFLGEQEQAAYVCGLEKQEAKRRVAPHLLDRLQLAFCNCLSRDKSKCEWPNVRVHNADMRQLMDVDLSVLSHMARLYDEYIEEEAELESEPVWISNELLHYLRRFYELLEIDAEEAGEKKMASLLTVDAKIFKRLNKQFEHIEGIGGTTRATIEDAIRTLSPNPSDEQTALTLIQSVKKVLLLREEAKPEEKEFVGRSGAEDFVGQSGPEDFFISPELWYALEAAFIRVWDTIASLIDMYLLARLFRTFRHTAHGRRPAPSPRSCVIYVGAHHARQYLRVFEQLDMKVIAQASSDDLYTTYEEEEEEGEGDGGEEGESKGIYQCLDIRHFKRPFFSTDTE